VLCGGIANYNATESPPGPKNYLNLIVQRGRRLHCLRLHVPRCGGDRRGRRMGAGGKTQEQGRRAALLGKRSCELCGGCSRAATKPSSSCASRSRSYTHRCSGLWRRGADTMGGRHVGVAGVRAFPPRLFISLCGRAGRQFQKSIPLRLFDHLQYTVQTASRRWQRHSPLPTVDVQSRTRDVAVTSFRTW
jgi:hypothetical protein